MKINYKKILLLISLAILVYSCGEKFDLNEFNLSDGNPNIGGDTVYIQLNPVWEGFNKPQDIIVGNEPFIYVADTENDRIVMLNLDGRILGTRTIEKPIALAQDFQLNLIVSAKFDTIVNGISQTYNAIYKIDLASVNHQIEMAPINRLLPKSTSDLSNPDREYKGVTVFYDNSFVIARTGPKNSSLSDPDNSLLLFKKQIDNNGAERDSLTGRIPGLDPLGGGIPSAYGISSIKSFSGNTFDLIFTLTGSNAFKAQWLEYIDSREFTGYVSKFTLSENDFMLPNRFSDPEGLTIDAAGNIYVVDSEKDSIYKFNSFGDQLLSFGGQNLFNHPHAAAHFDKTLYIADTENNRIIRFILSTDIQ
ncbi:MAG: hypothetical protein IPH11_19495 [Ignavibacteriales bacterium]|nr:hypothetical protein [Ignavibacteriales bacterium]